MLAQRAGTGIKLAHMPYAGAAMAVKDLLGVQLQTPGWPGSSTTRGPSARR